MYYIQLGRMVLFILFELILDYILGFDFRHNRWMVVGYATLFFAAIGGIIGLASLMGKSYNLVAIVMFFLVGFLAIFQRINIVM